MNLYFVYYIFLNIESYLAVKIDINSKVFSWKYENSTDYINM